MATKNPSYKKATPINPVGILVHSTGANNPNLKRYVDAPDEVGENKNNNTWNREDATNSVHAVIGKDINGDIAVAQILPYTIACWGCGKGKKGSRNYNPQAHIQFEICEDDLTNEQYFNSVYEKAVEYCAYLCEMFDFNPLSDITSHAESYTDGYASNHKDPLHWFNKFNKTMDGFRQAVYDKMVTDGAPEQLAIDNTIETTDTTSKLYKVQVGAFSNKENAEGVLKALQADGYTGYIKEE